MKKLLSFVVLFIALAFMAGCIQEDQTAKNTVEDVANNLFSNVDLNKVSSDLDFVENLNGVKITYVSSNQDVVSNTGKVTLGDNVEIVEINVTFEYDGYKLEKTYVLTVEKKTNKYTSLSVVKTYTTDTDVVVKGVVSRILNGTEKNIPTGFYIFDETDAIYVYSTNYASTLEAGDEVEISGTYKMYIDEKSSSSAAIQGYTGARQIVPNEVTVLSKNNQVNKNGVKNSSIAELAKIPVSENITSNVYLVTAKIRKSQGNGFVNYYFNDLNGVNSFYAYTTANGKDLGWLEQYNGQVRNCLIAVQNCKLSASGSFWRIIPLEVLDEVNVSDKEYATYSLARMLTQFSSSYEASCQIELTNTDTLLEGSKVSYEVLSGDLKLNTVENGYTLDITCTAQEKVATVKVTVSYNGEEVSEEVSFICQEKAPDIETISIKEAREKEKGENVTIKGIVVGFLYLSGTSKPAGFELIDETGSIAVFVSTAVDTKTDITKISKGELVYVNGNKDLYQPREDNNHAGSIRLNNAEVLYHDWKNHDIPSEYIADKPLSELITNPSDNNITNIVYKTTFYLEKSSGSYKNFYIHDLNDPTLSMIVYSQNSSSKGVPEYDWLEQYVGKCVEAYVTLRIGAVSSKKFVWKAGVLDVLSVVATPDSVVNYQVSGLVKKAFNTEYTKANEVKLTLEQGTLTIKSTTNSLVTLTNNAGNYIVNIPTPTTTETVNVVFEYSYNGKTTEIAVSFKLVKVETLTIAECREKAKKNGDTVVVEGIVIAQVRSAGAKSWGVFIADATGTMFCKQTSTAEVGDKVTINGKLDLYYGLPQIATGATVTVVSKNNEIPTDAYLKNATIADLVKANEAGETAKLGGMVYSDVVATIHVSSSRVYISVDDSEIDMYYYANAKYYEYNYKELESLDGKEVKLTLISYNVYNSVYTYVIASVEELA